MKKSVRTVLSASVVVLVGSLTGCADIAELVQARDSLDRYSLAVADQKTSVDGQIAALQATGVGENDPAVLALRSRSAELAAAAQVAEAGAAHVSEVLAEIENPDSALNNSVGLALPLLPGPWQAPVLLGAALFLTVARAAQLKRGMVSVIESVRRAGLEDAEFQQRLAKNATIMRLTQTPTAARTVDSVLGGTLGARLPI